MLRGRKLDQRAFVWYQNKFKKKIIEYQAMFKGLIVKKIMKGCHVNH
jgi:hypothetical protein